MLPLNIEKHFTIGFRLELGDAVRLLTGWLPRCSKAFHNEAICVRELQSLLTGAQEFFSACRGRFAVRPVVDAIVQKPP